MTDGLDPGLNPELADLTDEELYDTLEQQYERGEALNPEFVWEVLKRTHAQHRSHTTNVRREMDLVEAERDRLRATATPLRHVAVYAAKYLFYSDRLQAMADTDPSRQECSGAVESYRERMREALDDAKEGT